MPPSEFWQGVEQFNHKEFYACHDTFEALWMDSIEPQKRFYQGILQIAVGCYHLSNLNWRGAVILLGEGIKRLRDYEPDYEGIQVDFLVEKSYQLLLILQQTEPENVKDIVAKLELVVPNSANSKSASEGIYLLPKIVRIDEEQ
jgi:hypothetical protein